MSVQLRAHGILTYKDRDQESQDCHNLQVGREKLQAQGYNGEMSSRTRSKVKSYVTSWLTALNAANGSAFSPVETHRERLVFITLTLPAAQTHTDNELKRIGLQPFLQQLKRKHGVSNYLWRMEPQRNGNAHFHILTDQPVPHKEIRKLWNQVMRRLGYVSTYRRNQEAWHSQGFRPRTELYKTWPQSKQREAYKVGKSQNWSRPNTTDIHALRNVQNVTAYVVKYMSKGGAARVIDGRIWECSEAVRNLKPLTIQDDPSLDLVLRQAVAEGEAEQLQGDGFTFYRCQTASILEKWYPGGSAFFQEHWQTQAATMSGLVFSPVQTLASTAPT